MLCFDLFYRKNSPLFNIFCCIFHHLCIDFSSYVNSFITFPFFIALFCIAKLVFLVYILPHSRKELIQSPNFSLLLSESALNSPKILSDDHLESREAKIEVNCWLLFVVYCGHYSSCLGLIKIIDIILIEKHHHHFLAKME